VEPIKKQQQHSVIKSAIYFAFGTLISRILGLVRDAILVGVFGLRISDAYLVAFRFPNLFRRVFGEGAVSASFIPLYMEYKEKGDRKSLGQLTAGVFSLLMIVLTPLTVVAVLSMDWIIPHWLDGKGFSGIPGKMEMTILMSQIMFPFLILVCIYAYLMALLNAHKMFMLSSLAAGLLNLTIIFASLWCYWSGRLSPEVLAWSVILGGIFQFMILIPSLRGLNIPFDFSWASLSSLPVKRAVMTFLPGALSASLVPAMAFINSLFAARLEEGATSYIYLADRLLELPLSLIAVSLGTAMLPTLSAMHTTDRHGIYKTELLKNIQLLLFLCIPAAVGMWMTSDILVPVLFERGAFSGDKAEVVAQIVKIYAFTLITASLARVMSQAFYAAKNTFIPSAIAVGGLLVHLVLAPILMARYQVYGLVASTAVATLLNCIVLFVTFNWSQGSLAYGKLFLFIGRSLLASVMIVAACIATEYTIPTDSFFWKLIYLAVAVVLSALGYFAACALLKVQETEWILRKLKIRV
jgi:putative peptidoglycan lipid II flippase